jgi:hypothetical protein
MRAYFFRSHAVNGQAASADMMANQPSVSGSGPCVMMKPTRPIPTTIVRAGSTRSFLSVSQESMKGLLKAIVAGALIWVAINLVAIGYQPAHAGSVVATVDIVLSLVVAILACVVVRWP